MEGSESMSTLEKMKTGFKMYRAELIKGPRHTWILVDKEHAKKQLAKGNKVQVCDITRSK